mmetsp:Transcript_19975/g.33548  ORF Transcript_19975/g.33548 Transcript_19975/m.33548 type:complete len:229 (+) Transcript_19975:152-838(+)
MIKNPFAALEDAEENPQLIPKEHKPNNNKPNKPNNNRKKRASKGKADQPLVWIDLEMTGLDLEKDVILQIAVIITDGNLENVIEGPELVIHHSDEVLSNMNDWCIDHHGSSGLTAAIRESKLSMKEAETQVLQFVKQHVKQSAGVVAGNSVYVDVGFLKKDMRELADYFHYRILDVSTVKELARRWFPADYVKAPKKQMLHTAMADIRESLEELRHWRKAIFKEPPPL